MDKPTALVAGGTHGLGLELALRLKADFHVVVVGRDNSAIPGWEFFYRDFSLGHFITNLPDQIKRPIELFIYAAGTYQEGTIGSLKEQQIVAMAHLGLTAPASLLQSIIKRQTVLPGFIAITSTSQFTPRPAEPVYTAVKSALGMLAHSVSFDPAIGKTLVVAPAGMKNTDFYKDSGRDTTDMLEPSWVAEQILSLYNDPDSFTYQYAKILRGPARVEIVETR